jgi:hypothetical protein
MYQRHTALGLVLMDVTVAAAARAMWETACLFLAESNNLKLRASLRVRLVDG